jgi:hypothetical protein
MNVKVPIAKDRIYKKAIIYGHKNLTAKMKDCISDGLAKVLSDRIILY